MTGRKRVAIVTGGFDNAGLREFRLLEEASRHGLVHVLAWTDEAIHRHTGKPPRFPEEERIYLLTAIRCVHCVTPTREPSPPDVLPQIDEIVPAAWVIDPADDSPARREFCRARRIEYHVPPETALATLPAGAESPAAASGRKKVVVTGCFDWLHSGHVRFFEEASSLGDLLVGVGSDENIRQLKGPGHPMFPEQVRRYMVAALRHVAVCFVNSGQGLLDAAPEIARFRPDIYLVNEDGDNLEKREFCRRHALEYVVLRRAPRPGLAPRTSTDLRRRGRGFS